MRFEFDGVEERFKFTPRFGNEPEAEPGPFQEPCQAVRENFEEREIPDEGAKVGRLNPPRSAKQFTRHWYIQMVRLKKRNDEDLQAVKLLSIEHDEFVKKIETFSRTFSKQVI